MCMWCIRTHMDVGKRPLCSHAEMEEGTRCFGSNIFISSPSDRVSQNLTLPVFLFFSWSAWAASPVMLPSPSPVLMLQLRVVTPGFSHGSRDSNLGSVPADQAVFLMNPSPQPLVLCFISEICCRNFPGET